MQLNAQSQKEHNRGRLAWDVYNSQTRAYRICNLNATYTEEVVPIVDVPFILTCSLPSNPSLQRYRRNLLCEGTCLLPTLSINAVLHAVSESATLFSVYRGRGSPEFWFRRLSVARISLLWPVLFYFILWGNILKLLSCLSIN